MLQSVVNQLENYPISLQLWASQPKAPGNELDLSQPVNRNLTIDIMDGNLVAHSASENDADSIITIESAVRGVLSIRLNTAAWAKLKADTKYVARVKAYGATWLMEPIQIGAPSPGLTSLNGVRYYCAPSNILEILGTIPGAIAQTLNALSMRWSTNTNAQGYWTLTLNPNERLWGLWVDRLDVQEVEYADLATGATRAWARVGDIIYYKGPERIGDVPVESAFSIMVRDQIRYASEHITDETSRHFGMWRSVRETQNGMHSDRQLYTREYPIAVDEWFRVDAFGDGRYLNRRYTEKDVSNHPNTEQRDTIHVEGPTGGISLNQSFDFGNDFMYGGYDRVPQGRNNIEITYSFGDARPPAGIEEATAKYAAIGLLNYWERSMAQGLEGPSLGCVNIKFADSRAYYERWKADVEHAIDYHRSHHTDFL